MKPHVDLEARRAAAEPFRTIVETMARFRGLSLSRLAHRMNISRNSLYLKLHGESPVELYELHQLAEILEIETREIVGPLSAFTFSGAGWVAGESNPEPAGVGVIYPIGGHSVSNASSFPLAA